MASNPLEIDKVNELIHAVDERFEHTPFRVEKPATAVSFWCIWGFSCVSRLQTHRRFVVRTFANPGFPAIPQATTAGAKASLLRTMTQRPQMHQNQ